MINDDAIPFAILMTIVMVLAMYGAVLVYFDARTFGSLVSDCSERGFIQNHDTRIICSVEPALRGEGGEVDGHSRKS